MYMKHKTMQDFFQPFKASVKPYMEHDRAPFLPWDGVNMSPSPNSDRSWNKRTLEWSGGCLLTVSCQRLNIILAFVAINLTKGGLPTSHNFVIIPPTHCHFCVKLPNESVRLLRGFLSVYLTTEDASSEPSEAHSWAFCCFLLELTVTILGGKKL